MGQVVIMEFINCKQYVGTVPDDVWEKCYPFILAAAQYAHWEFTPEFTRQMLEKNLQQMWVVRSGEEVKFVWITEILQQQKRKVVMVTAAGGEMVYGWEFWPMMSKWMRRNEIQEAEVLCRPSVSRLLQRKGLQLKYNVLTIEPMETEG